MSKRINFTIKSITNLEMASKSRYYIYDQKINGLGLTVTSKGSKSFFVYRKIKGIPKRIKIGKFPDMAVEQARKNALVMLSEIAGGKDPVAEKKLRGFQESPCNRLLMNISAHTTTSNLEQFLTIRKP